MKVCKTREIKRVKAEKKKVTAPSGAKLFSGTLHFVSLSFPNNLAVPSADIGTAIRYTQLTAPLISDYCSAYGSNSLEVNQDVISHSPSTTSYNDATLQQWADSIAKQNSIPNNDCLVFLNPHGAINSDADATKGVLGYHSITSSFGIPYCFVNVLGKNLTIDDRSDLYAVALSHEVAEMCVDPLANLSEPEISDECAGNCVLPGSLVLGDNKPIEDYCAGDYAVGASGLQQVLKLYKRESCGNIVTIKALGLLPMTLTEDHPVLTVSGKIHKSQKFVRYADPIWKKAIDVSDGDYLVMPKLSGNREDEVVDFLPYIQQRRENLRKPLKAHFHATSIPITIETAWLVGLYVAEGCSSIVKRNGKVIFTISKTEVETKRKLIDISSSLGFKPYAREETYNALHVIFNSLPFALYLEKECGKGAANKKIPDVLLFHKDEEILSAFLSGYMEGDGCRLTSHGFPVERFVTTSQILAQQLQLAYGRLGLFVSLQSRPKTSATILGRIVSLHERYTGEIAKRNTRHLHGGNYFLKVKKSVRRGYSGEVYNIATSSRTYLYSNAIVHNCNVDFRNFFDSNSKWIPASQSASFPPNFPYAFFLEGIVLPADAKQCPAPAKSCQYAPPHG